MARLADRIEELGADPRTAVPLLAAVLSIPVDPALWPAPELSPVRARQRTMETFIDLYHGLARHAPVMFILEDIHWADPSTVELLRLMIAAPRRAGLMMLLTARLEFRPTWATATNVTEIALEALDSADAETFIRKVARNKPLPPDVAWRIRERAAGNPLFLEEITRAVMESDALAERDYSWELVGTLSADVVPASMEASLMARMERLGEARATLQLAATVGREFSHELLVAVAQAEETVVRRHLDVMLASGLVYRHGHASPIYSFKHALVRDAAYNSLLRATRQRYHERIAEVLAERFQEVAHSRPELLAHHLSGARRHHEAANHWRNAGERAASRSAVNEAVAHLRHALADLELLPEDATRMDMELSVLTALAPVLMAVYGWAAPQVGETCKRAIDLASRLGASDRMYPLLWGLWTNQFVGGRLQEAMGTANQVLSMATATTDPMLEITARHATSYTHFYRGEYNASVADAQIGLSHYDYDLELLIAQTFQVSSSICSMTAKAGSLWMLGRQDEGIALMDEMLARARLLRHPPSVAAALSFLLHFNLYSRDWRRMLLLAEEAYDLSRMEGFAMWTACAGMYRGRARVALGHVQSGLAEVFEWAEIFDRTEAARIIEGSYASMLSEMLHLAGRSKEALVVSREGERRATACAVRVMQPEIFRTRGDILRDCNFFVDADEAYRQAVDCARSQCARSLELRALTSLLDLRLCHGHPGDVPAELSRAVTAMACAPDQSDLVAARELLTRLRH